MLLGAEGSGELACSVAFSALLLWFSGLPVPVGWKVVSYCDQISYPLWSLLGTFCNTECCHLTVLCWACHVQCLRHPLNP